MHQYTEAFVKKIRIQHKYLNSAVNINSGRIFHDDFGRTAHHLSRKKFIVSISRVHEEKQSKLSNFFLLVKYYRKNVVDIQIQWKL